MRILITGGAGFIGSHLADAYLAAGHDVAVLDNFVTGKRENLQSRIPLFQTDLRDRGGVTAAIHSFRPHVISHHAAQMSVKTSNDDPVYDAECNVLGLLHVLEAAVAVNVRKIIFASSGGTVYGDSEQVPTPENAALIPMSPYGLSKLTGERYLEMFARLHDLPYTVLRYGNVYGPRQDPHGEAGVVAIFAKKLLAGEAPTIHWDGEQRKDYVHVRDVVRANMAALTRGNGQAFNVGSGVATSVNELYQALATQLGTAIAPQYGPRRPGDVRLSYLDVSLAGTELGWRPEIGLAAGMVDTIEFFAERAAAQSDLDLAA